MPSTLDQFSHEAGRVLKVFASLVSTDGGPGALLRSLGWDLPPGATDVGLAAADFSAFITTLDSLEDAINSGADDVTIAGKFGELFLELQPAIVHLREAIAGLSATGDYLDKTQIKSEFLDRLIGMLVASRIGSASQFAFVLFQFFGVLTLRRYDADPSIYQVEHVRSTVDWHALTRMITDPIGLLESRYGWGTAAFLGNDFVSNLSALLEVMSEPVRVRQLPRRVEEQLTGQSVPEADTAPAKQLIASILRGGEASGVDVGVSFYPLRPTTPGGLDAGIGVSPFVYGTTDLSFPLTSELVLSFDATVALDSGIALSFRPGAPIALKAGLMDPGGVVDQVSGKALVLLTLGAAAADATSAAPSSNTPAPDGSNPQATGPYTLIALPGGGVVEVASITFGGGVDVAQGSLSPSFALKLTGGHASLRPDGSDSFVSSLIPSNGVDMKFDFGVRWSSTQGFSFEGSASASTDIPLNLSIAGLVLSGLHLGVLPSDTGIAFEVSVVAGASIGPIAVLLQRFGALVTLNGQDGNLGPFDLSLDFKPPSGVGLAVDTGGVSGGGFLSFDPAQHEYTGVLQLQFNELALQAFGIITTQVAGSDGYSLIALVDANFPPIELGLGFTLDGVGGLLAIHRTAAVDALRTAMKAGQLSTILFPKNAITNAAQILAQLDALFPTAPGRFLFGPMALIGWGTPTVLTASIAVILELPEPIEIIILGVLQAKFPTPSAPLVKLNMDALGVIDFSQDEVSLDATLFDSKLITFTISGDMALRANWSSQGEFLLSIGGFHPQFTPPPGFPTLKRITIDMPSGIVSKLRLAAYLAVTSNSLQFGAALDVFIGVSGFGLSGHLGFDALLQLNPFHFEADISGSIALTAGGDDLMSVSLDATLTGPAPWNIAGKFKVHIVFFDVHISFSQSWGLDAPSQQVSTIDVGALLSTTLADPRSWNVQLPTGLSALVSTRQVDDPTAVFAHPLARIGVHERLVPLDLAITRFGQATPSGATEFSITKFQIGTATVDYDPVQDQFAPAQFFDLSDTDKLSRPSFELHDAGVVMSGSLVTNGTPISKTTDYETYFIDTPGALRVDEGVPQSFPWGDIIVVMLTGSAAQKQISRAGNRRYTAPGNPIKVAEPAFALVDTTTLTPQGAVPAGKTTYSDVHAILTGALTASPNQRDNLQIVATHEMVAV
jgi:hypothetical protein